MRHKDEDLAFLVDTFGIPAARAAALIAATPEEADYLAARYLARERRRDPYGDVPVPDALSEHEVAHNAGLQKPVLDRDPKF
ncbi:hypothetical protein [Devosia elaeis]|uniref:Uncharacterized protein n=1 Tax=Devosia elaeis TaxID=1770058 RepID=A0A178HYH6_9HYPH|nr:hypothetical protein [Devosia elaeis]OAM77096.1 hypothetical protein A3840_10695 [Devosia elaeis]